MREDLKSRAQAGNVLVNGLPLEGPFPNQSIGSRLVHKGIQEIANLLSRAKFHLVVKSEVREVDIHLQAVSAGNPNDTAFP